MREIETDYLVVGAGASAMAFVDALLDVNPDIDVVMVDRRFRPGGHWNDAYPFVRLHQPSSNYGVHSRQLGNDQVDVAGPNAGFYERASGAEIVDYFGRVMDETFLPSGRVTFLAKCDYRGVDGDGHRVVSLLNGDETIVKVRRRFVDATVVESSIPSRHTPPFTVDDDVRFVTPNTVVDVDEPRAGFTVLGAGKTAMDTCGWLMDNGVAPDRIQWVRPREIWAFNRAALQPLDQIGSVIQTFGIWTEAAATAQSGLEWLHLMEDAGAMHRLDPSIEATCFRGAVLSDREVKDLRSIENVVRGLKIRRVTSSGMQTTDGDFPTATGQVFVDCTANGVAAYERKPVFTPGRITLQYIVPGTVTWGASMIGAAEGMSEDDAGKNALVPSISLNSSADEVLEIIGIHLKGNVARMANAEFTEWHDPSRVNMMRGVTDHMDDPRVGEGMTLLMTHIADAMANHTKLYGDPGAAG